MRRQGTSALLIPLFAAVALFYPSVARKSSVESVQTPSSVADETATNGPQSPAKNKEWRGGSLAVKKFFRAPDSRNTTAPDPRDNTTLKFLIVTVPDPVDSGLPHVYDRYMAAIQAAVQTQPYFLSRFDLPWEDCLSKGKEKEKDNKGNGDAGIGDAVTEPEQQQRPCKERRYRKEPGFLLLSNPTGTRPGDKNKPDKSKIDLLLVYLVGETPTSGIQKRALAAALDEISWFCGWREGVADPAPQIFRKMATGRTDVGPEVRILGPSYSGSAQSLDLALSFWWDTQTVKPSMNLISGSATAIKNPDSANDKDFYNIYARLGPRFSFHSMEVPDSVAESKFCEYLRANSGQKKPIKVAILSEGGTVYGHQENSDANEPKATERAEEKSACDDAIEKTTLPYPSHISQLRAVSEKLRQAQQAASPQTQASSKTLPLAESLEDAGLRRDVQTFSPANAVTAEQVMANLLSTISREHYKYVGILATDTRDTMFLAQEVREHSPSTVLFTFGPDLLYLHPEINQTLRGMLIVSSYPLTNSNQLWSVPSHPEVRLQFPDDGTEGVYNAALALLGDDQHMVEFSPPFVDMHNVSGALGPPVWITVVGRDRLWPVTAYDVSSDANVQKYTYRLSCERAGGIEKKTLWRGLYSETTLIFATAFAVLCIIFSLPLLKRFSPQRTGSHRPVKITDAREPQGTAAVSLEAWFDRVLGEAVSERHRPAAELCLLAACASLGTFLVVLVTALFLPAETMKRLNLWEGVSRGAIAAFATCCVAAVLLAGGSVALLVAILRKRAEKRMPSDERSWRSATAWGPIPAGSLAAVVLALLLSWNWISPAWNGDPLAALFSSMRSLDLLSGVSALTPLFLISIAGFVWAVGSFKRLRQLDVLESKAECAVFARLESGKVQGPLERLNHYLRCPSLNLPASILVLLMAAIAGVYLRLHLVRSLEYGYFYGLLIVSFFFVSLALWHGVLRFCHVWQQTHHVLQHFSLSPMRAACKRFRESFPALPKIDLASSAATLTHLECSIEQARTLWVRARRMVEAEEVQSKIVGGTPLAMANPIESAALQRLAAFEVERRIEEANHHFLQARKADAAGRWREVVSHQCASREALSSVATEVADVLESSWWTEMREPSNDPSDISTANREKVFRLAEDFLAGRLAHFLSCVFPHMQNLIFTSVAGLLLLLFAVSSYPFQPHNVLLLFNWVIILSVVGIALWVFIQMSRDPILSHLNGTKPGQISWDGEFIFRVFTYGIVPILALLGAQFPQGIGQILSHLVGGEGMHP